MIRIYLAIFIMLSLKSFASDIVEIEFTANTKESYQTTHLLEDLKTNYQMEFENAYVLLIETPSLSNSYYKAQNKELDKFDNLAETYQVLFVVASLKNEYHDGYYTSIETAKKLLGKNEHFRIRLLDSKGVVLNESLKPVNIIKLKKWLEQ